LPQNGPLGPKSTPLNKLPRSPRTLKMPRCYACSSRRLKNSVPRSLFRAEAAKAVLRSTIWVPQKEQPLLHGFRDSIVGLLMTEIRVPRVDLVLFGAF